MFAPAFGAIAAIFLWWLTVDANTRWSNEYVTTGLVLLSVTWSAMVMVETWTLAHSHFKPAVDEDSEDEQG